MGPTWKAAVLHTPRWSRSSLTPYPINRLFVQQGDPEGESVVPMISYD